MKRNAPTTAFWLPVLALCLAPGLCAPQDVLFIRGADRSGGFLEAGDDASRTEHLADIYNGSTASGNHGWSELRQALEGAGFTVTQVEEDAENASGPSAGIAVPLDAMDLDAYDVIVLGSNNAVYDAAQVDALEDWVRAGGGALFISDANFGGSWADAPRSDQQFLDRFGLVMNQDRGTYVLRRGDGDFNRPDHPILAGVEAFDGEGVSPIVVDGAGDVIVGAQGTTRVNEPPFDAQERGATRSVTPADAALAVLEVDAGRIAGHFDRNTFFNANGAGTNINRHDNRTYALNLFRWLAGRDAVILESGFESPRPGPDNTGPVDEALLTPMGSLTITEDGAVVENVFVSGSVKIQADNVTLRNFRIDGGGTFYGIRAHYGHTGGRFEDGEILNVASAAILGTGFVADRLEIHESGGDGLKVQGSGGPTVVMRSWIHHLGTNDGAHADGNQSRSGRDIAFIGNYCDMPVTDPAPYKSNACLFLQAAEGPLDNVEIRDNWLNGGNYTIYCSGTNIRITGNRFGRDYRYGIRNNCSGANVQWSGNTWEDTGEAIP